MLENVLQNLTGRHMHHSQAAFSYLFHISVNFFIYVYKDGRSINPIIVHDQGCYSICLELVPCCRPCQCCVCWCLGERDAPQVDQGGFKYVALYTWALLTLLFQKAKQYIVLSCVLYVWVCARVWVCESLCFQGKESMEALLCYKLCNWGEIFSGMEPTCWVQWGPCAHCSELLQPQCVCKGLKGWWW